MNISSGPHQSVSITTIESGVTLIAVALAFAWPRLGAPAFSGIERMFGGLVRRKGLAVATVGLSVIMLRLAILPIFPIPLPFVPDDFSFLLAADTFAHGRLTNPTPAMWTHFETLHVTMVPTYQSMYLPGQGLLLAAGTVLFGHPWFALLAMDALMCAGLTWMLQAWLPPQWALLGGFIAVIRLGLFSDWINAYHTAGSLSALGGALVLGALPRLKKTARFRYGLLMGVGIAMLILTRPYEGMLLCLPVAVVLGRWAWKGENRPPAAVLMRRAAIPLGIVVATLAWLGYYDLKNFGKATTLPYTMDRAEYAMAPYFVWQHARPEPHYRHPAMRDFYEKTEMSAFNRTQSLKRFLPYTLLKALITLLFYAGPALFLPLIMMRRVLLDRRIRFLVLCTLVLMLGLTIEIFLMSYYEAPYTAVFYGIGLEAMRHLRVWKPEGRPVGIASARLIVFLCVALAGMRLFAEPLHLAPPEWPPSNWDMTWFGPEHYGMARAQIEARLDGLPGRQLVIVHYSAQHYSLDEWVYNSADINDSKVIWAGDMGAADNLKLIDYYRNRRVWLVEPDAIPVRIVAYEESGVSGVSVVSGARQTANSREELEP